jgi:hypothetical protein
MMYARREYATGSGPASSTTTYTYSFGNSNGINDQTTTETVTDGSGNQLRQMVHNYTGNPYSALQYTGIAYNNWREGIENWTAVTGMHTTEYTWEQAGAVSWCDPSAGGPFACSPTNGNGLPANNPRRRSVKTTLWESPALVSEVTFDYDDLGIAYGTGRLKKVSNNLSTTTILAYDPLGRVLASQQSTGGKTYNFSYNYDLSGAMVSFRQACMKGDEVSW